MSDNKISRRKFLANAAALSSALAIPSLVMGTEVVAPVLLDRREMHGL